MSREIAIVAWVLFAYWSVGCFIACVDESQELLKIWAIGLIYPMFIIINKIAWFVKDWKHYTKRRSFYKKRKITRWEYLRGIRASIH